MSDTGVDTEVLHEYARYVDQAIVADVVTSYAQAEEHGCAPDGFTGLLEPLKPVMELLAGWVRDGMDFTKGRMEATAAGLVAVKEDYEKTDGDNAESFEGD
ncbi:hypothetical protein EV191_1123 [Tamaricihabitans halophyticus]|uniref:Excreted virulence factor EspC (Type VII ESX diderm) n=1 Tax=Tamaricihabitans halophyticus TaxID=1262583 RepID=A0A4R2QEX3_9PSEU|nr:hypothetical protein [Tamaricihabitans halophyticus]TCP47209.1 hypothetical protein EV191_1123 [Tamaricihabitans halophyticus]